MTRHFSMAAAVAALLASGETLFFPVELKATN